MFIEQSVLAWQLKPAQPFMEQFAARRAFTLVEILVVIAVLGLLAAILFPAFARSRETGRRAACASNLKQLGLAWQMYADDSDGRAMPSGDFTGENLRFWQGESGEDGTLKRGSGLLSPWLKGSVLGCPSWPAEKDTFLATADVRGYGYNFAAFPSHFDFSPIRTTAIASIQKPAELVLFADSARFSPGRTEEVPVVKFNSSLYSPKLQIPTFHGRHLGTGNVVWADGHVKAMAPLYLDTGSERITVELQKQFEIGFIDRDGDYRTDEFFDLNEGD